MSLFKSYLTFPFISKKTLGWYENEAEYRQWAKEVWFGNYSRKQSDQNFGSSGFEHVFLGETRSSGVTGFHNWLQFYFLEKAGDLEYYGYVRENEVSIVYRILNAWLLKLDRNYFRKINLLKASSMALSTTF